MAIPDYQTIMLPLLQCISIQQEHAIKDVRLALMDKFTLSDEEKNEMLPSGKQRTFDNRVHWAKFYLMKAGLLDATRRGYIQITKEGDDALNQNLSEINNQYLAQFNKFNQFISNSQKSKKENVEQEDNALTTPEETLEAAFEDLRNELKAELLKTVLSCSASYFEHLVVDLLVSMGYGGTKREAGKVLGQSGDEGIDGTIKEDKLGLDIIYIQAKRWQIESTIGRPEIQKFAGALQGKRAKKGIFITTTSFSKEACNYVKQIDSKIILIDGDKLTDYLIDYNVGVETMSSYIVKKIDYDYFSED